jgi:hypothetical protein
LGTSSHLPLYGGNTERIYDLDLMISRHSRCKRQREPTRREIQNENISTAPQILSNKLSELAVVTDKRRDLCDAVV